jgi:Mn-dependent DtxR family transcriptional regulator
MVYKPNLEPTTVDRETLDYIRKYQDRHGEDSFPTVDEIASRFAINRSAAHRRVQRMRDKGLLTAPKVTIIRSRLTAKARRA